MKVKTTSECRHPAGEGTDKLKRAKRGANISTESNASACEKKATSIMAHVITTVTPPHSQPHFSSLVIDALLRPI
jgi:hypothetical protein